MSNCTSSCKTQDHDNFGDCLRAKNIATAAGESTKGTYSKAEHAEARVDSHGKPPRNGICTSGCPTQDHATLGECYKAKNVTSVALESVNPTFSRASQKSWDGELKAYEDAVAQGIQPASTQMADIRAAVEVSNATGTAYRADGV